MYPSEFIRSIEFNLEIEGKSCVSSQALKVIQVQTGRSIFISGFLFFFRLHTRKHYRWPGRNILCTKGWGYDIVYPTLDKIESLSSQDFCPLNIKSGITFVSIESFEKWGQQLVSLKWICIYSTFLIPWIRPFRCSGASVPLFSLNDSASDSLRKRTLLFIINCYTPNANIPLALESCLKNLKKRF